MVSVLLFDFGGTLDGPLHWLDRFLSEYRTSGVEINRDELDPAFDFATRAGYRARPVHRFGLEELARFLVGNQFEFLAREGSETIRATIASLDSRARHRLVEQIAAGFVRTTRSGLEASRSVLGALRGSFRLGVVSNFYGNLDRILEEAGMKGTLNVIVDSSRVGIFKPDPRIFQFAMRELGANPSHTAMIGDSLDKDCAPARSLGLRTVWYHPAQSPSARSNTLADFRVASLGEIGSLRW
jgi:putative hydrolase of the HAD superfamily